MIHFRAVRRRTIKIGILCVAALLAAAAAPARTPARRAPNHIGQMKGHPAPPFELKTIDDKTVTLQQFKGRVVLIDYWATWCGPCRDELPHTQKLADDAALAERGLSVLAIDKEETADKVRPFLEKHKYTFTVPMDTDHKFGDAYFMHGLPVTVVIGREGIVKAVFIGYGPSTAPKIDAAIEEALKEPAPATRPAR